jgi:hypothetical protein
MSVGMSGGTFGLAVVAAYAFSPGIAGKVLTFRTRAQLKFAPPTRRMSHGQSQDIPHAYPGRWVSPRTLSAGLSYWPKSGNNSWRCNCVY